MSEYKGIVFKIKVGSSLSELTLLTKAEYISENELDCEIQYFNIINSLNYKNNIIYQTYNNNNAQVYFKIINNNVYYLELEQYEEFDLIFERYSNIKNF